MELLYEHKDSILFFFFLLITNLFLAIRWAVAESVLDRHSHADLFRSHLSPVCQIGSAALERSGNNE